MRTILNKEKDVFGEDVTVTRRLKISYVVVSLLLFLLLLMGCVGPSKTETPTPTPTTTPTPTFQKTHINIDGKMALRGSGEPVELINKPNATNPTFAELVAFLERDQTDKYSYILGPPKNAYICTDFAETVHNNAEAAGIRAAWVGIDIEGKTEGHALNAFQTTDLGLVYIDCTGKGLWDESPNRSSWDRRAYVEIGKPYAVTDLTGRTQSQVSAIFSFFVATPRAVNSLGHAGPYQLEKQIVRSLQELGWMSPWSTERQQQTSRILLEWVKTHDIETLGQRWMQEWIREHEAELGYIREGQVSGWSGLSGWSTRSIHVDYVVDLPETPCWVQPDVFYHVTPWGQTELKLRDVDGVPIVWKVDGGTNPKLLISWSKPVTGIVKNVHIHW